MAPSRFKKEVREKREVTPFENDPLAPPEIPAEWRDIEAPVNFTWVVQDELCGMGWPKSRDQVNFLIKQGIDHLITLAADKIPPHYAFPELKWTMIPVEDFTGPAIADIKKFIQIMAEARRDGEAVGVHCAEGRGRTGVICACYLIYYYDMEPWDAIRIMRRQRPGSVERKVQEETVVMFYELLNDDFGCLDNLESKEKEYLKLKKQQQLQNDNLICTYTALLHGPVNRIKNKDQKQQRMRRARSMPKMNEEIPVENLEDSAAATDAVDSVACSLDTPACSMDTIKDEQRLRKHFDEFFDDTTKRNRTVSHERSRPPLDKSQKDEENVLEQNNRFERGTTPGRTLVTNLKPAPRKSDVFELNKEPKCDLKQHFKSFMSSTSTCKRARSFSQPRVVENEDNKNSSSEREVPPPLPTSAIATSSQKQSKPSSSFPARKVSRQTDEREKWLQDGVQSEKASRRPSRSVIRGEAKPPSESSGSERTSATDDILEDKPVLEDFDNKDYDYDYSTSSRRSSEISAGSSLQQSMTSITSDQALPPQPPKYKPQMDVASNTSTYYARVRTRASNDLSKKRDSLLNSVDMSNGFAPNSANVARKFDATARKHRSKTIEIGFTVKENKKEDDLADKEVENILSSESVTSMASEATQEPPSMSSLVITTPTIKSPTSRKLESRTSSDSLKVKGAEETPKRMSPFNRFKNSLVLGTSNCSSPSSRNSKTPTESSKSPLSFPTYGRRERTESETSTSRSSEKRSRFFYRKSRTGPVGNASEENQDKSNSIHSSASNSTSNLTTSNPVALKEVEIVDYSAGATGGGAGASGGGASVAGASIRKFEDRHAVRAKSEFSPRSTGTSNSAGTSTSNEYVSKDNYFLAAAKRWAAYDKPSYNTPFTRDHWRKSHRKFNYSRFLNYTRETFV